jgi:hypothetical protein
VANDDATQLAYVEVLPDEKQATTVGFLLRCVPWPGSMARATATRKPAATASGGFSRTTAAPTAPGSGEKPAQLWSYTKTHQAVHPTNQWQSRTVHQDPAGGVGVFDGLSDLNRAEPLVAALSGDL